MRRFFTLLVLLISLVAFSFGQRTGGSRSYGGSYSSPSRSYSAPSAPSRSYSSPSNSSRSYGGTYSAPNRSVPQNNSSKTYNSNSFSNKSNSTVNNSSKTYNFGVPSTSSRTYGGGVVNSPRPYTSYNTHHYYESYGAGGMPWWGYAMLWHQQQPIVITQGMPGYMDPGMGGPMMNPVGAAFNLIGFFFWMGILTLFIYVVYRVYKRVA